MTLNDIKKADLPDAPGVYYFVDTNGRVLYIGKATSLKNRVRSYFSNDVITTRGPRIVDMVTRAKGVRWKQTESVLEALLLEANEIKKYQPRANVDGKDDKSYLFVVITKERVPRVCTVRGRELEKKFPLKIRRALFGPFPHGTHLREALKLIRKMFPYVDTPHEVGATVNKHLKGRAVFNQQIGISPLISNALELRRYLRTIKHLQLFFEGKKTQLLAHIERDMHAAARREHFEEASDLKRRLFALKHIQDVSLIKKATPDSSLHERIEAYDIAHLAGTHTVGVMTVVSSGIAQPSEYRSFNIKTVSGVHDTAALTEILKRRLAHTEWPYPKIIVVDGSTAQKRAAERILVAHDIAIPVVAVVKDETHRPKEILGKASLVARHKNDILLANLEAHRFGIKLHRKKRTKAVLASISKCNTLR